MEMDEEIRNEIRKEMESKDFWKGVSFAISVIKDRLSNLENELIKRQMRSGKHGDDKQVG